MLEEVISCRRFTCTPCSSSELPTISTLCGSPALAGRIFNASSYCREIRAYVAELWFSKYTEAISNTSMSAAQITARAFAYAMALDLEPEVDEGIEIAPRKKCQHNERGRGQRCSK